MRYRNLGASDLCVSVIGLGCNNFGMSLDAAAAARVVHAALDQGVTFFDTAAAYGKGSSEQYLGQALTNQRAQAVIATKFGGQGDPELGSIGSPGGRRYVHRAVDAALQRLGTDYIDVMQLHRPDPMTPIGETLAALDEMRVAGKIRHVGCSGFSASQLAEAVTAAREIGIGGFISALTEWSLLERNAEAEFVPAALRLGCGVLPAFPLASGLLTGKVGPNGGVPKHSRLSGWASKFITKERVEHVERLRVWADQHHRSLTEVALGWLAAQPAIGSVIVGASTPQQVITNAMAANWIPLPEEILEISAV